MLEELHHILKCGVPTLSARGEVHIRKELKCDPGERSRKLTSGYHAATQSRVEQYYSFRHSAFEDHQVVKLPMQHHPSGQQV